LRTKFESIPPLPLTHSQSRISGFTTVTRKKDEKETSPTGAFLLSRKKKYERRPRIDMKNGSVFF
jgi:hypothetical protein